MMSREWLSLGKQARRKPILAAFDSRAACETLESRVVPASTAFGSNILTVDFDLVGETVTVANDGATISLTGSTFSGAGSTFPTAAVSRIVVTNVAAQASQTLTFGGAVAFGLSAGLDVAGVETVNLNANVSVTGSANVNVVAGRNISVSDGATISTTAGNVLLDADTGTQVSGSFVGAGIRGNVSSLSGVVTIEGRGGDLGHGQQGVVIDGHVSGGAGTGARTIIRGVGGAPGAGFFFSNGVRVEGTVTSFGGDVDIAGIGGTSENITGVVVGGTVSAGSMGNVRVQGNGGTPVGDHVSGVAVGGVVTSGGGNVVVIGTGALGALHSDHNYGVVVSNNNATISSGGSGSVSVTGYGGGRSGGDHNYGILVANSNATISSGGSGNVTVTGYGGGQSGGNWNYGILVANDDATISSGGAGSVSVIGNGGGQGGGAFNHGILLANDNAKITSGVPGNVSVIGNGGGQGGGASNYGVQLANENVKITSGGSGTVSVTGYGGGLSGGDANYGVLLANDNAMISSGGLGSVSVTGIGGGRDGGDANNGVLVLTNAKILSGGGAVSVVGRGGAQSGGNGNFGVLVAEVNSMISSGGSGNVSVSGYGGGQSGGNGNRGILITVGNAKISSGGSGSVSVSGYGGGGDFNDGVVVTSENAMISSGGSGAVTVSGYGGGGPLGSGNNGVVLSTVISTGGGDLSIVGVSAGTLSFGYVHGASATTTTATNGGNIRLVADSVDVRGPVDAGTGTLYVVQRTAGVAIALGGADASGVLGLTASEVNWLLASTLVVGDVDSGPISAISDVIRTVPADFRFESPAGIAVNSGVTLNAGGGSVTPLASVLTDSGTIVADVSVPTGSVLRGAGVVQGSVSGAGAVTPGANLGILTVNGDFTPSGAVAFEINAPYSTAGVDYDQIVVGAPGTVVNLGGAAASFGSAGGGTLPAVITLISNATGSPTLGTFAGLPNGSTVTLGTGPNARTATLLYNGGDGNDVVLVSSFSTGPKVYVDDGWVGLLAGTPIADADFGTAGSQPAVFGTNAFASIGAAVAGASSDATIVVNGGTYAEHATPSGTQTLEVTGADAAQTVVLDSLSTVLGQSLFIRGGSTLAVGGAIDTAIAGAIGGTGHFTKTGGGTIELSGANALAGLTTVASGRLTLANGSAIADASAVLVKSGAILSVNASETIGPLTLEAGALAGAQVALGSSAFATGDVQVVVVGSGAAGATIVGGVGSSLSLGGASRTFLVGDGAAAVDLTISTSVSNGSVVKSGAGTVAFAGTVANAYAGTTHVIDGVLSLAKSAGIASIPGPGAVTIGNGVGASASAILRIDANEQVVDTVAVSLGGVDGQLLSTVGTTETILPLAPDFRGGDVRVSGLLVVTGAYAQGPGAVAGTTTLAGGVIRVLASGLGNFDLTFGTLQGTGTIVASTLFNASVIDPGVGSTSAGQIGVLGNVVLQPSGFVNLHVGGTSVGQFDQLNAGLNPGITPAPINVTNGTVLFQGTLNTGVIGGYVPSVGAFFDVVNFETRMLDTIGTNHLRLPSDFATKILGGPPWFDASFLSATNQLNAESYNSTTFGMLGNPPPSLGLAKKLRLTTLSAGPSLANDKTSVTSLAKGGFTSQSTTRHQHQFVTVKNLSATPIVGPIYLEVTPSISIVRLYNRAGLTLTSPGGKAYLVVSMTGLAPGESVTAQLDWLNPNLQAFTYSHRVLAGGLP